MSQPTINGFLMLQSGHWVKLSDGSGPYSIDALGVARLLGIGHNSHRENGLLLSVRHGERERNERHSGLARCHEIEHGQHLNVQQSKNWSLLP